MKHPSVSTLVSICGNVMMAVTFLLIGPVPFLGFEATVGSIIAMEGLVGIGFGMVAVSTFTRSQRAARQLKCGDDISTYMMISGEKPT